jgi:hypothetical protein
MVKVVVVVVVGHQMKGPKLIVLGLSPCCRAEGTKCLHHPGFLKWASSSSSFSFSSPSLSPQLI